MLYFYAFLYQLVNFFTEEHASFCKQNAPSYL